MDPFIDTAILADQTVQGAARLRNTTLQAMAQKAQWRISQTMEPDFSPIGSRHGCCAAAGHIHPA